MPNIVTIDFQGVTPMNGGMGSDHIPPGKYAFKVSRLVSGQARSGATMMTGTFSVASGPMAGKRIIERFVLPKDENDQKIGISRFYAFLLALGVKIRTDAAMRFDMDALTDRPFIGEVVDNEREANDKYPARTESSIDSFHPIGEATAGAAPAPAPVAAAPVAPAPAPVAVAVAPAELDGIAVETALDSLL